MSSVVIVDDQGVNRRVLSTLAASLEPDVQVQAFGDPLQALSYIREHTPDLLITDYQMPTMNGAELIRRFRDVPDCRDVPAVVVTAYEDIAFRATALDAGANEFILSPLNHTEFRQQSRRLLAQRHSMALDLGLPAGIGPNLVAGPGALPMLDQFEMFNRLLESVSSNLILKIGELKRMNAELQNLLEAGAVPAVFVDETFRVRHFTPQITKIYGLSARDIGRSLDSVDRDLDNDSLSHLFRKAMETGESVEHYVVNRRDAERYLVRIIPNRYVDASPVGALIIFTNLRPGFDRRSNPFAVH
jgi:CheY-like chemotaxis protein